MWCAIVQIVGKHVTDNFHLLQKFVQTLQQLFYNFCQSVGHDECNFYRYELMMDKALAYRVQEKTLPLDQGARGVRGEY